MLSPLMLLGLLGLSVPVVIHLIQRQRMQPRLLATFRFLEREAVSNAFAPVPRDWLQLLLRLLLLALFALLMARFTAPGPAFGPRTLAIVLDGSMSMQRKLPSGRSLFDTHKAQILELVDGMGEHDLFSFALVGDAVFADTGFTRDKARLRRVVAAAEPSDGGGRGLGDVVRRGLRELRGQKAVNVALLVFSDQQPENYDQRPGAIGYDRLLESGAQRLFLVREPVDAQDNVAIEWAEFHPPRAYLGTGSKLTATVRNFSAADQEVEVSFAEGAKAGEARSLLLGSGEVARVELAHIFESSVDSACVVSLADDPFPTDNAFNIPMQMRKRRQVLLVAPPKYAAKDGAETGYNGVDLLVYAINPEAALGLPSGVHTALRRVAPDALERIALSLYSSVILYGLSDLPGDKSVADLVAYASAGGGIGIIPDPDVNPVRFNEAFAPLLGGFKLGAVARAAPAQFLDTNEANLDHPLLLPLLREEWGSPGEITCATYFDVLDKGAAAGALRTRDGHWLAATVPIGNGRVYLQAFSCSIRDTAFPRSLAFVPMLRRVLDFLSDPADSFTPDVIRAGDVRYMDLSRFRGLGGNIVLDGPRRFEFPLTADGMDVRVDGIYNAGHYAVSHPGKKTGRRRWLGVNPGTGESNPTTLDPDQVAATFGPRHVEILAYADVASRFARRTEIFTLMFILVVVALVAEALAGAWQARGKEPAGA